MSKKYIIGIDGGSQSTKVVMYDLEGNVVCEGKGLLQPMHTPDADTAEHPDDDLWASLCFASHDLMSQFAGNKEDIVGIGLGSIRCCRALLKADGTPAAPLISWQDARVTRPYEHTNPDVAYVTSFSGYLTHRLTGEFKDNIANYFGQWPVDYKSWAWSEDATVMEKFNIPRQMLFDVQMPGTILGHITPQAALATHFPAGLPVVCTTSDKPVEALGAGLLDDETAVISLGTYIALMMNGKALPKDPVAYWPIMSSIPQTLLYEGYGIRKGMWTVSWLRDMLGESLIQDAKAQDLSPEDLLNKKASCVALTLKNNYDNMCHEMNHFAKHVIITGGGSNSDLFMQIFADVFNLPARRNAINGCASLGAAINTAVGLGLYPDYTTAVDKMVRVKDIFIPIESNAKRYDAMNKGIFKDLTKHTDVILKKSYEVMHGELGNADSIQSWSNA